MRTALILTAYNRPRCVADAIASVREQSDPSWRLYLMDDGSDAATRHAIAIAIGRMPCVILTAGTPWVRHGRPIGEGASWPHVVWWQGPPRSVEARRATIPYSRTINRALTFLLSDEQYVTQLCDDDWLMPRAIEDRAQYLDEHPEVEAVYGRLRAVRYGASGRCNDWEEPAGRVVPGRRWIAPDGVREFYEAGNGKHFYLDGKTDPDTGLPFVEEGYWQPGPLHYGRPYTIDHNQLMIRRSLLTRCNHYGLLATEDGATYVQYWPEDRRMDVGDAGFFLALNVPFVGIDSWTVTKRYHVHSDGCSDAERRE